MRSLLGIPQASDIALNAHPQRGFAPIIARVAWLIITVSIVALDLLGIPASYTSAQTVCSTCSADLGTLTPTQLRMLHDQGVSLQFWAISQTVLIAVDSFVYIGLGLLIFLRRADDRMAYFASLMLVTFGGAAFTGPMHALPGAQPILWLPVNAANALGQILFVLFFYVFPDGRFVPRWAVVPSLIWSASWIMMLFRQPVLTQMFEWVNGFPVFPVLVSALVVSQVYRYRRVSTPHQRHQTKWVVYGFSVGIGSFLAALIFANVILTPAAADSPLSILFGNTLIDILFLMIPAAIAIAILRSRLYEIDVLINRTLVYGTLSALLAGMYFSSVVLLQQITRSFNGQRQDSTLEIILSTLLIAALFRPLRRRIQRAIDRRFYRSRYDAAKTLAAFSATLRQEVDLRELNERLLGVVEETMRPAHASLWLCSDHTRREE